MGHYESKSTKASLGHGEIPIHQSVSWATKNPRVIRASLFTRKILESGARPWPQEILRLKARQRSKEILGSSACHDL